MWWGQNINWHDARPQQHTAGVAALASGDKHVVALLRDGSLWGWGDNTAGQLTGLPGSYAGAPSSAITTTFGPGSVRAIAAGSRHTLILMTSGNVVCLGQGLRGQCDLPSRATAGGAVAVRASGTDSFVQLADGQWVAAGVSGWALGALAAEQAGGKAVQPLTGSHAVHPATGELVSWKRNDPLVTRLNHGGHTRTRTPVTDICAVDADTFVVLLRNGSLLVHPDPATASGATATLAIPSQLQQHSAKYSAIACGANHAVALRADGVAVAWGAEPGDNRTHTPDARVTAIAAGAAHSVFLLDTGAAAQTGSLVVAGPTVPPEVAAVPVQAIAAGRSLALALTAGGKVVSWGPGRGADASAANMGDARIRVVSAGDGHALALSDEGRVYQWGEGIEQQPPAEAAGAITAIAAGSGYSLALKADGKLLAWGRLGSCLAADEALPDELGDVAAISAGQEHSLVLLRNGSVATFGCAPWVCCSVYRHDTMGTPPAVVAAGGVVAVAAGATYSLVLLDTGRVVAWGYGPVASLPPQLDGPAAPRVTAIAGGPTHAVAHLEDGSVVSWGEVGRQGELAWQQQQPAVVQQNAGGGRLLGLAAGGGFSMALVQGPAPSDSSQSVAGAHCMAVVFDCLMPSA